MLICTYLRQVKSKVSSAYAVLRLPTLAESHAHAEQDEGQCHVRLSMSSLIRPKYCYKKSCWL